MDSFREHLSTLSHGQGLERCLPWALMLRPWLGRAPVCLQWGSPQQQWAGAHSWVQLGDSSTCDLLLYLTINGKSFLFFDLIFFPCRRLFHRLLAICAKWNKTNSAEGLFIIHISGGILKFTSEVGRLQDLLGSGLLDLLQIILRLVSGVTGIMNTFACKHHFSFKLSVQFKYSRDKELKGCISWE